jgi:hypothetical protein
MKFVGSARPTQLYQVRSPLSDSPEAVAEGLALAATAAVRRVTELDRIHPGVWAGLYDRYRDVFRRRLMFFKACGIITRCSLNKPEEVFWDPASGKRGGAHILLLEVRRDALRFVWRMTALTERHVRRSTDWRPKDPISFSVRVSAAIRTSLADRLFYSPSCQDCPVRSQW